LREHIPFSRNDKTKDLDEFNSKSLTDEKKLMRQKEFVRDHLRNDKLKMRESANDCLTEDSNMKIKNEFRAGCTIISKITNSLNTLKTLSAMEKLEDSHKNFDMFTHHGKAKNKEFLYFTYDALREAVLELFLSVKIRSDEEIDNYNEEQFREEKRQLAHLDGFTLIDEIKNHVEVLMNMKVEEQDELENPELFAELVKIERHA